MIGKNDELSDLPLTADVCTRGVPKDEHTYDVRMTKVAFNDVVQTLEVQPDSNQYDK